jgi:type II secretory pathway pseudopilin PulG
MLVGLIVAIFIILLVMGVAAPKVARDLRREREVEAIHRGNQYVRAIRLYYLKNGNHYPGSIEQLEKTNNIRFLRQRYADPMTGKPDWRLIKVGEAKTTVKGFFGQPLAGLTPGLGTAAGMASGGGIGTGAAGSTGASSPTFGGSSTGGLGSGSGSSIGGTSGSSAPGAAGGPDTSGAAGSTGSIGGGIGSQSATSFSGGGAPFVGVGSSKSGESITVLNEQPSYQTWEFIYDPRIEQLKAKASLFGGGPATSSGSTLGSAAGSASPGQSGATSPTSTSPTTTPTTPSYPSTMPQ